MVFIRRKEDRSYFKGIDIMKKIFLTFIGIMSLSLLQASGHDFISVNNKEVQEFINKGLMSVDEYGKLDVVRPIDKAIFVAIRNGASHELVQPLLTKSWKTSNSKKFDDYLEAEIKSAYRSYSPTVLNLQDKIMYAQKADQRAQYEKDLERFQNFYK